MPNIRIKDIPTTASATSSTDFIGIDGSANGTRKLNAFSPTFGGNLTVSGTTGVTATDLTLGTSGPSVKSTLSARAPRQGLVLDGTSSPTVSVAGPGTGDFTVAAWVYPTATSGSARIVGTSTYTDLNIPATSYRLTFFNGVSNYVGPQCTSGKWQLVVARRAGGVLYLSVNAGTESSFADSTNIGNYTRIGSDTDGNNRTTGALVPLIYNRALSASEVVALYEAGAPAGADYNSASNTNLATSTVVASGGTLSGESATGFTMTSASGVVYVGTRPAFGATSTGLAGVAPVGSRWLVTFTATLTSGAAPSLAMMQSNSFAAISNAATVTAGANSVVLTTTSAGTWVVAPTFYTVGASTYTISSIVVTRLGLLLAPDAAQAGGGLTWYDTSGNAANITLPASGVSWNVPSSLKLGGNWTAAGNLNASGGFYVSGSAVSPNNTACVDLSFQTTYGKVSAINRGVGNFPLALNPEGGSVLVNTTTNSGNGAVQLATHTTSAGGIGFGTDVSLYRATVAFYGFPAVNAALFRSSGSNLIFSSTNYNHYIGQKGDSGDFFISATDSITLQTRGNASNGTTALTLDSSQNATFKGTELNLNPNSGNAFIYSRVTGGGIGGIVIADSQASGRTYGIESGRTAGSFAIRDYTAAANRLTIDSAGDATFAGAVKAPSYQLSTDAQGTIISSNSNVLNIDAAAGDIRVRPKAGSDFVIGNSAAIKLGNAYTAGAPTATGYVTIKDSAGNTYKVLVGT